MNDVHTGVGAPPPDWISVAKRLLGRKAYPLANGVAGLVDVMVTLASGLRERLTLARAMRRGEHVRRHDVITVRGRTVRIEGGSGEHNADGVAWPGIDDMTDAVRHRAWRPIR